MASISSRAAAINGQIENVRQHPRTATVIEEAVTDVSERFALWARNIGAFHPQKSQLSLESRLRDAPEIRDWVCELLDDLADALTDLLGVMSGETTEQTARLEEIDAEDFVADFSLEIPGQLPSKDEAHEILAAAVECCRGLLKTSMLIRNASLRDRFKTALQRTKITFMDHFDIGHTREKYPKLAKPSSEWLVKRLGRAITMRRQFLWYCREHQDSLGHHDYTGGELGRDSKTYPEPLDIRKRADGHLPLASGSGTSQAGFTDPGTKASTLFAGQLNATRDEPKDDGISYTSTAHSDFAEEDMVLELPSLQTLTKDNPKAEFECPFCHIIQKFKREREWRLHAFSDLKSYVCTMGSAECDLQLFADSNTWLEHELQNHRCNWVCTLCRAGSFRSSDLFRAHVDEAHPDLTESEAQLLNQASRRPLNFIPAVDCPFCDEWEQKIRANVQKEKGTASDSAPATQVPKPLEGVCEDQIRTDIINVERSQFRKHVGSHMEQLALFAIPRTTRGEYDSSGQQRDNCGASSNAAIQSLPEATLNASEAELNWLPDPPLHLAAFKGDVEEVQRLLDDGADVEAIGETWGTALSAAETGGHTQLVTLLRSWQSNNFRPPVSQDQESMTENKPQSGTASNYSIAPVAPEEKLGLFLTSSLQITDILGVGTSGVVYSAIDLEDEVKYAVKCFSKFNVDGTPLDRRQAAFQTREIRLHYQASAHPNVVSLLKVIDNPDCIYVILEYCPEGDLFFNITERGEYVGKADLCKRVFLQILDAVEHCHSLGIYLRGIKPEAFVVTDGGETLKLASFGLATTQDRSEEFGCGSTFYMSPECLDNLPRRPFYYCAPADVWSLGVILVNLTTGKNPWKQASYEDSSYREFTRSPGYLKTILPVTDELADILARVFTRDPNQRITIPELRARIVACNRFTELPASMSTIEPPPYPTKQTAESEEPELGERIIDDWSFDFISDGAAEYPGSAEGEDGDLPPLSDIQSG